MTIVKNDFCKFKIYCWLWLCSFAVLKIDNFVVNLPKSIPYRSFLFLSADSKDDGVFFRMDGCDAPLRPFRSLL